MFTSCHILAYLGYDTVDHNILLSKLQFYGIKGPALSSNGFLLI